MPLYYYGFSGADAKERFQFWLDNPPSAVTIDVETISLTERYPLGLGIGFSPYEAFYFDLQPEPPRELELIIPLLEDARVVKVAHNWLFDMGVFPLIPIVGEHLSKSNIWDTNIAARLLGYTETSLPILSFNVGMTTVGMGEILRDNNCKDNMELVKKNPMALPDHCQADCRVTYKLYLEWRDKIYSTHHKYFNVEMAVIPILVEMSMRGIAIDQDSQQVLEDDYTARVERYGNIVKSFGVDNPSSTKQVGYILAKRGNLLKYTKKKTQLRTDKGDLGFLDDPMASAVLMYRKSEKFLNTYLVPLRGEDRFYTEYYMDTVVGRMNSRHRNIQNIPSADKETGDLGARFILTPDSGMFTTGDYCLAPSTRVLTTDLKWKPLFQVNTGDRLIGIDEYPKEGRGRRRKLRSSLVLNKSYIARPSKTIITEDERSITASYEHPWLVLEGGRYMTPAWIRTDQLRIGDRIRQIGKPWETDTSYEAGWLAGFLDGEGWIDTSYHAVGFGQNDNEALEYALSMLDKKGFQNRRVHGSSTSTIVTRIDHQADMLRLIGSIRPKRLMPKSDYLWEGYEPPKRNAWVKVKDIIDVGEQPLVSIATSTYTYIAEGLFTHNSKEHMYILAQMSQDRDMLRILYDPDPKRNDIHQYTADKMGVSRKVAKTTNYAVVYGATAQTLMEQLKSRDRYRCSKLLEDWFRTYRGAADWIRAAQEHGLRTGWSLPTLFGRSIAIPLESQDGMKRKAANYPILGSDGEVIKRAIIVCNRKGLGPPMMCITVHDSITWDGDVIDRLPIEELENIPGYRIPFEVKQTYRWE